MAFAHTIGNRRYACGDLRELLARATPLRSGDALAGRDEVTRLIVLIGERPGLSSKKESRTLTEGWGA